VIVHSKSSVKSWRCYHESAITSLDVHPEGALAECIDFLLQLLDADTVGFIRNKHAADQDLQLCGYLIVLGKLHLFLDHLNQLEEVMCRPRTHSVQHLVDSHS
jgi:hypothetical protein